MMTDLSSDPQLVSRVEFDTLFEALVNWGRWGAEDELGTLNYLDDAKVVEACALAKLGRKVPLGRPLDTAGGRDNPKPALHHMTSLGDQSVGDLRSNRDFIGVDYHGLSVSHIDALPHMVFKGRLYNDRSAASAVGSRGSSFAPISRLAAGIVTRGVLLDAPRAQGSEWIDPPDALDAYKLKAIAARLGVEVRRGDAVLLRSGHLARQRSLRPSAAIDGMVGLHPRGLAWLAEREIAILGGDGNSDASPSPVEGIALPIHALALVAMGMCLLDNLDLEALGQLCEEVGRFEFLLVVAPLIVPGGTGSPVNPIAVL